MTFGRKAHDNGCGNGKNALVVALATVLLAAACVQLVSCSCAGPESLNGGLANDVELAPGQDFALDAEALGSDYTWKSDDETVAVVNENGEIVAKEPGETYVTITVAGQERRIKVTVGGGGNPAASVSASDTGSSAASAGASDTGSSASSSASSAAAPAAQLSQEERVEEQRKQAIEKVPMNEEVVIYGGDVEATPGDKDVMLVFYIERNPGILGMTLTAHYDDSAMTITNATVGAAFEDVLTLTKSKQLKDGCKFTWDGVDIDKTQVYDGAILVLTMDVPDSAKAGTYKVDLTYDYGDIVNGKLVPLDAKILGGTLTVG